MKSLRRYAAWLLGLVFFLSGMAKLSDPVGTGLIFESYLKFFHITFLMALAKALGFVLSLCETVVGIALLTGIWRRVVAWITSVMTVFFTLISLALLIFNPDMDCGCFGQLVHLTHTQTFVKNIVLLLLCAASFLPPDKTTGAKVRRYVSFALASAMALAFGVVFLNINPLTDNMDYKASTNLIEEGKAPQDSDYKTLTLLDEYGADCSYLLLEGPVAVVSVYDPQKLSARKLSRLASFAQDALNAGYTPVLLSSDALQVPGLETYYADRRVLLSLNRTNGGYTYIDDGYIVCKKSHYPSYEEMEQEQSLAAEELCVKLSSHRTIAIQLIGLAFAAVLLLL